MLYCHNSINLKFAILEFIMNSQFYYEVYMPKSQVSCQSLDPFSKGSSFQPLSGGSQTPICPEPKCQPSSIARCDMGFRQDMVMRVITVIGPACHAPFTGSLWMALIQPQHIIQSLQWVPRIWLLI